MPCFFTQIRKLFRDEEKLTNVEKFSARKLHILRAVIRSSELRNFDRIFRFFQPIFTVEMRARFAEAPMR